MVRNRRLALSQGPLEIAAADLAGLSVEQARPIVEEINRRVQELLAELDPVQPEARDPQA